MEHHTVGILWQEIWSAFQNRDDSLRFFLDRQTGEIFAVPANQHGDLQKELEEREDQFLPIPPYDYEQERLLLMEFIDGIDDLPLRRLLRRTFEGDRLYGRSVDILSFYPDEEERWQAWRDTFITCRIRSWLEEHDIYADELTH